jgi:radical SAM superfamily enzyme YgiQ (UPF0313 family)
MKCLLISLQSNAYVTGLKYLSANILSRGHDARILLMPGFLEKTLDEAAENFIEEYDPDLIGIGLMSIEFYPAKNLTRLLRDRFDKPVVWGGVHAIIRWNECLVFADYVCIGEGESAIVSLLEHLKEKGRGVPPEIPNIVAGNTLRPGIVNAVAEQNLDSLPFQEYLPDCFFGLHDRKIVNFSHNPGLFRRYALYGGTCHMMITTRGCPFNCSYCANSYLKNVYGSKVRERSVENCIQELLNVKKDPFVLYINFEDDCFFAHDHEWIQRFRDEYKKLINLPFIVRAIPTMLDRDKLFMLKEAGLSMVVMGIQSGSDRVNFDIYGRRVRFSSVKEAARIINVARAAPFYEMIVDNPYVSEEDEMDTVSAMAGLKRPYIISLAHLTFFPGTPLAERAIRDNITDSEAYLYRYIVKIDRTYMNRLLGITPYVPRVFVRYLNKPAADRSILHSAMVTILEFIVKRSVEPVLFLFIMTRSLDYNLRWTARTIIGNWRSAISKLISNYLGKGDMEYDMRLKRAKEAMPELFDK